MRLEQRGFILVLVLWVLLALTIAASALAAWISRTTQQAVVMAEERQGHVEIQDTFETVKFLFATRPSRIGGLYLGPEPHRLARRWRENPFIFHRAEVGPDDLPLDGRWLAGLDNARFRLQDEGGLLSVNAYSREWIRAALERLGVASVRAGGLVDRLDEYAELRAAGAPSLDYATAGLPSPPGRRLLTAMEVHKVLGWHANKALWDDRKWFDNVGALRGPAININAAPRWLLETLPEIGPADAARLIEARRERPFSTNEQTMDRLGVYVDTFSFFTAPRDVLRLSLAGGLSSRGFRYTIRLTSNIDRAAPWRVEIAHSASGALFDPDSAQPVDHPLFASPSSDAGER